MTERGPGIVENMSSMIDEIIPVHHQCHSYMINGMLWDGSVEFETKMWNSNNKRFHREKTIIWI